MYCSATIALAVAAVMVLEGGMPLGTVDVSS
jgi:uncharacterized protein YjeT (DUF2065 family)